MKKFKLTWCERVCDEEGNTLYHENKSQVVDAENEDAACEIEQLQAEAERLKSDYLVVNFGHGAIEVAEGISEDAYALMLGNGVVGEDLQGDRHMTKHETLAVLKFHSLASIDVVLSRLNRLRQRMINNEPVEIKNDSGEVVEIITPKLKEQNHD